MTTDSVSQRALVTGCLLCIGIVMPGTWSPAMMVDMPRAAIVARADAVVVARISEQIPKREMTLQLPRLAEPVKRWFIGSRLEIQDVVWERNRVIGEAKQVTIVTWAEAPQKPNADGFRAIVMDGPAYPALQVGQTYLLVLEKLADNNAFYVEAYPKNYILVAPGTEDRVAAMKATAAIDAWAWGAAANGIQVAFVPEDRQIRLMPNRKTAPRGALPAVQVRFTVAVRNVSAGPIAIPHVPADRFLRLTASRGGQALALPDFYQNVRCDEAFAPQKHVTILQPGELILLARYGLGHYGDHVTWSLEPGAVEVSMTYASAREGGTKDGVPFWQGTAVSAPVELNLFMGEPPVAH